MTKTTSAKKNKKAAAKKTAIKLSVDETVVPAVITRPKIPNVYRLTRNSLRLLLSSHKVVLIMLLIYILFQIILASGLTGSLDIQSLKDSLQETFTDSNLITGVALYGALLTTLGSAPSDAASVYQAVLFIVFSLIFIFVIRHAHAGHKVRLADAFYKSCTPIIQFLLVLSMIAVHLVPIVLANYLFSSIFATGIAVTLIEQLFWGALLVAFIIWTLYLLIASIMAIYIVTLPDVRPLQALRTAKKLVKGRRLVIARKLLFLPLLLFIAMAIIVIPAIIFAAPFTSLIFFLLVSLLLPVAHSYLYTLYRALL